MDIFDLTKDNGYCIHNFLGKENSCRKNFEDPSILIDLCHVFDTNEFHMSTDLKLSKREKNFMFLSRDVAATAAAGDHIMGMCMDANDSVCIQMNSGPTGEYQRAFDRRSHSPPRLRVEVPATIERLKKYNVVANLKEVVDPFNKREVFNERDVNYPQRQVFGHGLYDFYYHHRYHSHSNCSRHKLSNAHSHFHEDVAHKVGLSSCESKLVEKETNASGIKEEVSTGSRKKHEDNWHRKESFLKSRKHGLMSQNKARSSVFCQSSNLEDEKSKIQENHKHSSSSEKSISSKKKQTKLENRAEKIIDFVNSCLPLIAVRQEALVFIAFCFVAVLLFLMRTTLWSSR